MKWIEKYLLLSVSAAVTARALVTPRSSHSPDACPGYKASNFHQTQTTFTADLTLAGKPCNVYGTDLAHLKLEVDHETAMRLHVKIWDAAGDVYQVPESVFPRPASTGHTRRSMDDSELQFSYVASPFSFAVHRKSNGEVLFNTSGSPLIFESQYLRLRTSLPTDPNLYGLGENSDHFRLNTTNYTRTLWSHDAYGIPPGNNLYGNHPVYYDHRGDKGTSGTFLLNSDGMDIKINTSDSGQYLEYNIIGGIFDFYFVSGPSPVEVAEQYSEISGKSAMMPYWGHGFHQCRYGYQDYYAVAEVIYNYSVAKIPLETMWTDIDYMDLRKVFSNDPQRFPSKAVRDYVKYLHDHDQHYIVMVDPAVAYQNYGPFNRGVQDNIFLKEANGTIHKGVVWPGVTAFPDWFSSNVQEYWNNEFLQFFNEETGFDIDAVWIDMNEPSNFPCPYPCDHPEATAKEVGFPPPPPPLRVPPRPLPGFPSEFQPPTSNSKREIIPNTDINLVEREYFELPQLGRSVSKRAVPGSAMGLPGRDLINPKYVIQNAAGSISNLTVDTDIVHENGYVEYDTHNLYGTMMSTITADAMQNRRPGLRPMVITRSTFAGAGKKVGHWLGDNNSIWDNYRGSIQGMLDFAALFQVPMVGSDVCGYGDNTTETLCARWATLGAFQPFYRNHNNLGSIPQEFYQWPTVAQAAKNAIGMRYQLLDYFYTAMHQQSVAGTPALNPLVFLYPNDGNTFAIDLQFFFGNAVLVSPVTQENVTTVDIYLPDDQFYDLWTYKPVRGHGAHLTLANVGYETIPLHVRGGTIIPMRSKGAMTTTALRKVPFNLVVAIGLDGTAAGTLYLDDGVSISQPATSQITFTFEKGTLTVSGSFGYTKEAFSVSSVTFLGLQTTPHKVSVDGHGAHGSPGSSGAFVVSVNAPLTHGFTVSLS